MKRSLTVAMAMFTMTLIALVAAAGVAHADPEAPQAGAPCWGVDGSEAMENAQTFTPQHEVLICVKNDQGSQWQHLDDIQRPVETWFTYGPEQTLAADDILPAISWVSASGRVEDVCTAVQTPADGGPPVTHTNNSGYYRDFALIANLATLKLSGYCDWRKAWQRAPG